MEGVKMNFMIPMTPNIVQNLLSAHQPTSTSLCLTTTSVMVVEKVPKNISNWLQDSRSDEENCVSKQSTSDSDSDIEVIEPSFNTKYIQPTATKILSSGKTATLKKIIESLPEEPEVITVEESNKVVLKRGGKPSKNWRNAMKEINYKCDICDEEFSKRYIYQRHMHEHSQDKPHHCPKCSASFNVPTNFTLHMATHNIGEPKCPMCNKRFTRIASLKAHMVTHGKDENLYCPECDGVFETKSCENELNQDDCSSL